MKKFISFVLCLIMLIGVLVLPEPIEVQAEESNESKEYYVELLASSVNTFGSDDFKGEYSSFKVKYNTDIVMYLVHGSSFLELRMLVVLPDGSLDDLIGSGYNLRYYANDVTLGLYIDGCYKFYGGRDYNFYQKTVEKEGAGGTFKWTTSTIEESGFISTNIPIFENKDAAIGFLGGSVSIKDAINYDTDISDIKYDLEVPKNIKIKDIQESLAPGYFLITWEQTDENYKNWQTEIYRYVDFKYRNSVLIFSWADWKYVDDYYVGQTIIETHKLSYKHRHMENVDDDLLTDRIYADYPTEYGGIYKYGDEKIYMRNFYFDGQYRHYSNWIVLEFDPEEDAWINPNMNSSIVEKEGSELITDGSGVPIQPDSDLVIDSEYTGVINENYERVDGTDLISWIKSGFGIGGDNGVLAIMKESFSFIPGEIWAVFVAGISLMVVVAVFKFIRG